MLGGGAFLVHFVAWCLASGRVLRRHLGGGDDADLSPLTPMLVPVYTLFYTVLLHASLTLAHVEWSRREQAAAPGGTAAAATSAFEVRMAEAAPLLFSDAGVGDFVLFTSVVFLLGAAVSVAHGIRIKAMRAGDRDPSRLRKEFAWVCFGQLAGAAIALLCW